MIINPKIRILHFYVGIYKRHCCNKIDNVIHVFILKSSNLYTFIIKKFVLFNFIFQFHVYILLIFNIIGSVKYYFCCCKFWDGIWCELLLSFFSQIRVQTFAYLWTFDAQINLLGVQFCVCCALIGRGGLLFGQLDRGPS